MTYKTVTFPPSKAAAIQFLNFLGREGQSLLLSTLVGGISLADVQTGKSPPFLADFAPYFKSKHVVSRLSDQWPGSGGLVARNTGIAGILTGQRSVPEALQMADSAFGV